MATIQKFYLHPATTTVTGTLPGVSTQSTVKSTPSVTATGASTNRTMNGTIGTSQTSIAITTLAQTTQQINWFARFVSPPLAAQALPTSTLGNGLSYNFGGGVSCSNTSSNFAGFSSVSYIWRPSTGARIGYISDNPISGTVTSVTTEAWTLIANFGGNFSILDGDVLIAELWGNNTQSMATAYTNTVFYDGTTEGSATSPAAYFSSPSPLTLYSPTTAYPASLLIG